MVGNCVTHYWLANKVRRPIQVFSLVHFGCSFHFFNSNLQTKTIIDIKVRFSSIFIPLHISLIPTKPLKHKDTLMAQKDEAARDQLAESLNDLFTSVSTMIKSQLQVLSLSLSNYSFFNKISGIYVILGYDFEIRGRIMS